MDSATMGELVLAGFRKLGFIRFAGIEGVEYLPGRSVFALEPKPEHLNHNGDLHAAILFGLAETAAMAASISGIVDLMGEAFIVARDGRIEYLARAKGTAGPIRATSELTAAELDRARSAIESGESIELAVPVDITDNTGKSVAAASFTAVIRPRRK
ncbi:PaaI family thioesterase [Nocardia sp. alder85J]|uniref:PaaI family thioesterase n=1 Tax=Nocardia sp. alder85J TaxID=2862949 RepID=UPI001CD3BF9F|nr:DUF4442 domain-containing protein [Nocardia sp. alder85J]MCX4097828.1 DUF4442 domain-containing protein [Nocardia sp. alder85J]